MQFMADVHLKCEDCKGTRFKDEILEIAPEIASKDNALFLGRGIFYPIAKECSLKLKEISYIHAEGYPAAEMKHGPIALIDEKMPVLVIATEEEHYSKILSNAQEAKARDANLIGIGPKSPETEIFDFYSSFF